MAPSFLQERQDTVFISRLYLDSAVCRALHSIFAGEHRRIHFLDGIVSGEAVLEALGTLGPNSTVCMTNTYVLRLALFPLHYFTHNNSSSGERTHIDQGAEAKKEGAASVCNPLTMNIICPFIQRYRMLSCTFTVQCT